MADFIFISPSVQFKEVDLTVINASLGITTAGLVGETTKGPAFEPIFVTSKTDFRTRFGTTSKEKIGGSLKYLLPYYADSYLSESNQLFVTRILGLSGFDAGYAWGIKISAGLDTSTLASSNVATGVTTFTNTTFSGQTVVAQTGITQTIEPTYTKVGTTFTGIQTDFIVNSFATAGAGISGTVRYTATTLTGSSYAEYEDMVVALIRTRGRYVSNELTYNATAMTITPASSTDPYTTFVLSTTGNTNETYTCSLDPTSSSYITKVLGSSAKDKNNNIYVEASYPDLIKKLVAEGYAYGVSATLVNLDTNSATKANYLTGYKTPETPWIVSELRGSTVQRLFKFISISDGDSANKEIKVSIQNINMDTKEFDVVIRDFNDTDDNIIVLESFVRCNLNIQDVNFIGRRIGDGNDNYDNKSKFVYLEFVDLDNLPVDAVPAGFEGYNLRSYASQSSLAPKIFYKTDYLTSDKLNKTYLGVSERGYDTSSKGTGLNQNLFNFFGELAETGITKTKGFHMDSGATGTYTDGNYVIGQFETGADKFQTSLDTVNPNNAYFDKRTRKFTLVPAGGFDGWDVYRDERTNKNSYRTGGIYAFDTSDYNAYLAAYQTMENPEAVRINILATPNINWSDHNALVTDVLEIVEDTRKDCIYIIDAPDLISPTDASYAEDIADLMSSTDLDTSYAATYAPYIQIFDSTSASNVYIPPTGEVLRAMAFTDNNKFPWFAPAGYSRGVVNAAKKTRYKLAEPLRNTLYDARINPIADFSDIGVDIFGQKTLQIKDSALDRINVRRLLLYLRQVIANVSVTLLFDQNDDVVVNEFLNKVTPILENVKRERGLNGYKIDYLTNNTPESRDRNELYFNLYLKPTSALEYLGIIFSITPSGVSFENV